MPTTRAIVRLVAIALLLAFFVLVLTPLSRVYDALAVDLRKSKSLASQQHLCKLVLWLLDVRIELNIEPSDFAINKQLIVDVLVHKGS